MLKKLMSIKSQKGATMIEYALLVALIAVVVMAAVEPLGTAIAGVFTDITGELP